MNSVDSAPPWFARLLRLAAAMAVGSAMAVWVRPINVPGRNLVPVGCGSPASPRTEALTDFICRDHLTGVKGLAVALVAAAGVLLLISEVIVPRLGGQAWVRGVALAAVIAVPVFAISVSSLFTIIARSGADGALIRCGTPMAPATDPISKLVCGQLAQERRSSALSGLALSALALVGAGYVTAGVRRSASDDTDELGASPVAADAASHAEVDASTSQASVDEHTSHGFAGPRPDNQQGHGKPRSETTPEDRS